MRHKPSLARRPWRIKTTHFALTLCVVVRCECGVVIYVSVNFRIMNVYLFVIFRAFMFVCLRSCKCDMVRCVSALKYIVICVSLVSFERVSL